MHGLYVQACTDALVLGNSKVTDINLSGVTGLDAKKTQQLLIGKVLKRGGQSRISLTTDTFTTT